MILAAAAVVVVATTAAFFLGRGSTTSARPVVTASDDEGETAGRAKIGDLAGRPRRQPSLPSSPVTPRAERAPATAGGAELGNETVPAIPEPGSAGAVARPVIPAPPPLHSAAEVDGYLSTLETRARNQHRATAAEVEPGIQAIMMLGPKIGMDAALAKVRDFNNRMAEISAHAE